MSDYEKGLEAALGKGVLYVTDFKTAWMRERINAFLAAQPEVWWCQEHDEGLRIADGMKAAFCFYGSMSDLHHDCRMVKARIVIEEPS